MDQNKATSLPRRNQSDTQTEDERRLPYPNTRTHLADLGRMHGLPS